MTTVLDRPRPRRLVRRRRPALDVAYETALSEFDPSLRPKIIEYIDALSAVARVRAELSSAKIPYAVDWYEIDRAAQRLQAAA